MTPNLLELAKQKNVKTIATLINRSVQPKGITVVKATLKDSYLQILLESAQVPNQQALFAFVRKRIMGLGAANITRVRIYGRQTGRREPAWSQEFELARQPLQVLTPNLLELAKQGNVEAIATLMNRSLQPKGITVVKTALEERCLQIMLESAQVPNQQALFAFVRQGITGLGAASIEKVRIYGRQTGEVFPAWSQEFELAEQPLQVLTPPTPLELAKQGNVEAIAALMNRALQPKHINIVKTAFKDGCLQIMLESAQVPNQQELVAFVRQGMTRLGAVSIERVKVYGRQTGDEFPAWSQEFEKDSGSSTENTALPITQIETNNDVDKSSSRVKVNAKPFVVNAHKNFWRLPSAVRFVFIGVILVVVSVNAFIIFKKDDDKNYEETNLSSFNSDEQYKYIFEDFIKHQLKNDEDIVESLRIFNERGGFEGSKKRAVKNCQALSQGVLKEKLVQDKSNEARNVLNLSKTGRKLTDKETQQINYLLAIYTAEVFAGQDVYCPETRQQLK